jgi:RES domain-containing protein
VLHDPGLLDALEQFASEHRSQRVFRHMLGASPPERANERGARWNPPGTAALYTSLAESTAVAEGDHLIAVQPIPTRATRTIYELDVSLSRVIDLSDVSRLEALGLTEADIGGDDLGPTQSVGGAVAWLGNDGLLVPSVRSAGGINLVVFVAKLPVDAVLEVVGSHTV